MQLRLLIISLFQIHATVLMKFVLKIAYHSDVTHPPFINPRKRYVFIANHQSRLDPPAIFAQFSYTQLWSIAPIRFMTAGAIYYSFIYPIVRAVGCYPTRKRKDYSYKAVDQSLYYLHHGQNIFIFPEGRRTLEVESRPRGGVVRIIEQSPVPVEIILVHIDWRLSGGKRRLRIRFKAVEDISSASAAMKQIYKL